jgi:NADH:ubiquinone reductase (non-electrogenic)
VYQKSFNKLLPFPYDIPYVPLHNNKGVREHCQFLKQIEDAASLRKAIAYCFERANIPSLSKKEISDALSFVIVGAGPTGVSFKQNAV